VNIIDIDVINGELVDRSYCLKIGRGQSIKLAEGEHIAHPYFEHSRINGPADLSVIQLGGSGAIVIKQLIDGEFRQIA